MSDLEELYDAPTPPGGSGEDRAGGTVGRGGSIGSALPSGNAPAPKRRGRPPSSSRLSGGNAAFAGGASAAAQSYLGAAGIGTGPSETADGNTGRGVDEEDSRSRTDTERTRLLRETSGRGLSPEPVALPGTVKRGRPRKVDVTEVEEKHVAHGICAIFGGVFTLLTVFDPGRPHKHWIKTTDKVKPISDPTTDWLNSLGEDARRKVQGCLIPAAILGGIAQVVGPDIQIEMEMRRLEREALRGMRPPPPPPVSQPPLGIDPGVPRNGNEPQAGGMATTPIVPVEEGL